VRRPRFGGLSTGRLWIAAGALVGLGTVAMSAYAAHGLASAEPAAQVMVRDAVQIQGWHALALLFCGLWRERAGRLADVAGLAFLVGLIAFCGGVYAIALFGIRLPDVAPTGGTLLMLGWLLLFLSALRSGHNR
jgi:uncharacterized membrane protein YgdD (TMEM256/DUF423 family)